MLYGTGNSVGKIEGDYIGTIQTHGDRLVLHVFELRSE